MSYCNKHRTNSPCMECLIPAQTAEIVRAINSLKEPELPPSTWQVLKHRASLVFTRKPIKD